MLSTRHSGGGRPTQKVGERSSCGGASGGDDADAIVPLVYGRGDSQLDNPVEGGSGGGTIRHGSRVGGGGGWGMGLAASRGGAAEISYYLEVW